MANPVTSRFLLSPKGLKWALLAFYGTYYGFYWLGQVRLGQGPLGTWDHLGCIIISFGLVTRRKNIEDKKLHLNVTLSFYIKWKYQGLANRLILGSYGHLEPCSTHPQLSHVIIWPIQSLLDPSLAQRAKMGPFMDPFMGSIVQVRSGLDPIGTWDHLEYNICCPKSLYGRTSHFQTPPGPQKGYNGPIWPFYGSFYGFYWLGQLRLGSYEQLGPSRIHHQWSQVIIRPIQSLLDFSWASKGI